MFRKIHYVIMEHLKHENNNELEVIGYWYFLYLKSDKEKFNLHLPFYKNELALLFFNYIRAFTFIFNLFQESTNDELYLNFLIYKPSY